MWCTLEAEIEISKKQQKGPHTSSPAYCVVQGDWNLWFCVSVQSVYADTWQTCLCLFPSVRIYWISSQSAVTISWCSLPSSSVFHWWLATGHHMFFLFQSYLLRSHVFYTGVHVCMHDRQWGGKEITKEASLEAEAQLQAKCLLTIWSSLLCDPLISQVVRWPDRQVGVPIMLSGVVHRVWVRPLVGVQSTSVSL